MLVYFDGGLTVRSRNGHDITAAVPELAPMAEQLAGRSVVLDGELVARQGRPWDFYGLGARLGARSSVAAARGRARTPVTFAAFDVLVLDGELVTRLPWVERRALLDGIAPAPPRRPGGDRRAPVQGGWGGRAVRHASHAEGPARARCRTTSGQSCAPASGASSLPDGWYDDFTARPRPGRGRRSDYWYAVWGQRYEEAIEQAPRTPVKWLAERHPESESAIHAYLFKAHDRGILEEAPPYPGKKSGQPRRGTHRVRKGAPSWHTLKNKRTRSMASAIQGSR